MCNCGLPSAAEQGQRQCTDKKTSKNKGHKPSARRAVATTQKSLHGACNMEYRMFAKEWESGTEIVQACLDLGVLGQVCEIARNRGRASAGRVLAERCCMKSTWFTNESKTISAELPSAAARGAVVHKC